MSELVLVKDGPNSKQYHRNEDGQPACGVRGHDSSDHWSEWGIEKANVWKTPCQRKRCYGDSAASESADGNEAQSA